MKCRASFTSLWLVFAVALLLRWIFIWQWQELPYALGPFLDAKAYDDWAREILAGRFVRWTAFYQSPLYAYLLALIYKILGSSPMAVAVIQGVISALTCVVVARTAALFLNRGFSLVAGLMAAVYGPFVFYSAPLLKETLMLFTVSVFTYMFGRLLLRPSRRLALLTGLALGACALSRGNVLAVYPMAVILLLWLQRRPGLLNSFLLTFGMIIAVLPATIHNYVASHSFVPLTYNGGFNFYIGHSPSATGGNSYPPMVSTDAVQEELDTRRIAEEQRGRPLAPSEVSQYWSSHARAYIAEHLTQELRLAAHKLWFFCSNYEMGDNYDVEFIRRESATILSAPLLGFGITFILALFGFLSVWRLSPVLMGLAGLAFFYMSSAVLFYVTDRYRLPAAIFLLPAAAAGLHQLIAFLRQRQWKNVVWRTGLVLPFVVLTFLPLPPGLRNTESFNWGLQATLNSDAGRDREAVTAIERAIAAGASLVSSQAYVKASTSYERLGDLKKAEDMLIKATEFHPYDGLTFYNLARFHYERGWYDSALDLYNKSLFISPYNYQPYIGLGVLHYAQKRYGLARESVRRGLLLNSENPQLQQLQKMLDQLPTE